MSQQPIRVGYCLSLSGALASTARPPASPIRFGKTMSIDGAGCSDESSG